MAAAMHVPQSLDTSLEAMQDSYPRRMTTTALSPEDIRSATQPSSLKYNPPQSGSRMSSYSERRADVPTMDASRGSWVDYPSITGSGRYPGNSGAWRAEKFSDEPGMQQNTHELVEARIHDGTNTAGAYNPPSGSPPYLHHEGFEGRLQRIPSDDVDGRREPFRATFDTGLVLQTPEMGQRVSGFDQYRENPAHFVPSSPRHPSLPAAGIGAGPSTSNMSPIVPLSAGPSYNAAAMSIPISPKLRAYAQQPTYITPASAPSPINPVYGPPPMPKEEICVECAMRDQDMADVDVTSPGVWERESDVMYEDLVRREEQEEVTGRSSQESTSRPRAKGGRLTEEHLKLWLSVNPKEPSSRQQTLDQYVKAQRSLLEAEALAHARALRESRQLDDKMRDAYSQLRRSAYELGSTAQPSDDTGGVRIKAPRTASTPIAAANSHSREVTLLENGMIVEHVDVRREEREERERRRREEKRERSRVRKSSRSSRNADVMSVYSLQAPLHTDSGFFPGTKGDSRYSQSISQRPSSVMTGGNERPHTLLRAQSQASFSDMQSIGSAASPRRSKFFGLKNLSTGWRSQDSLAPSGSMIDMHVALQREQQYLQSLPQGEAVDIGSNAPTLRLGESWPRMDIPPESRSATTEPTPVKKVKGLKKIWKLVTGSGNKGDSLPNGRGQSRSLERPEDDLPLAPPPPLSYLVNRDQRSASARRHVSTPSLPSSNTLSAFATSPQTAPSSLVPSPTSSRRSTVDKEGSDGRKTSDVVVNNEQEQAADSSPEDSRGRATQSTRTLSSGNGPITPPLLSACPTQRMSTVVRRDKSLPPLPGEITAEFPVRSPSETRPQTVFTYDPQSISASQGFFPPQAPFRTDGSRRQSFGGITSKLPMFSQTMPNKGTFTRAQLSVQPYLAEERYGEFGVPAVTLGQWPGAQFSQGSLQVPGEKIKKRKSKFGLAALFGKKSLSNENNDGANSAPLDLSGLRPSQEGRFDGNTANGHGSGYASPLSTSTHAPRMSTMSRKNIEELVEQDPDFIAYRYPSSDQRLDLLR